MNKTLNFTHQGKRWFLKRLKGQHHNLIPALVPVMGTECQDDETKEIYYKYYGKHYMIGWYAAKDRDPSTMRTIFGKNISIMDYVIDELQGYSIDLIHVVDLKTGHDQCFLHAIKLSDHT